jgi:hypothetical protein
MVIHEILKEHGIFSNDIKVKIKNGQIKLNGEVVTDPLMDLDIEFVKKEDRPTKETPAFEDAGNFLFRAISKDKECFDLCTAMGVDGLGIHPEFWPDLNFTNKLVEKFRKVYVLKISKKEWIILQKKEVEIETEEFLILKKNDC